MNGRLNTRSGVPPVSWLFTAVGMQVFAVCLCVFLAWHGVHHTREGRPTYHFGENRAGNENFDRMRAEGAGHQIEDIGHDLRDMMPWIDQGFKDTK